jgi:hypothetical protein
VFDHAQEPEHLIDSLIAFVTATRGIRPWYGVEVEKLTAYPLPDPLRKLYGALGNMPGVGDTPFAFQCQDTLLPFEWLQRKDDRLLFAIENQRVWTAWTCLTGRDPPVWFTFDDDEPGIEHPSLANFLVTLCLQELTMSSDFLYAGDGMVKRFVEAGFRVSPLWMHGLLPVLDNLKTATFHLVNGNGIVYDDDFFGFPENEDSEKFQQVLVDADCRQPAHSMPMSDFLADTVPGIVKRHYYESLAQNHQAQADLHQSRADECRRLAVAAMR